MPQLLCDIRENRRLWGGKRLARLGVLPAAMSDLNESAPDRVAHEPRRRVDIELFHHLYSVGLDRKSTRLNSSHRTISYAVFCLKKKIKTNKYRFSKELISENLRFRHALR